MQAHILDLEAAETELPSGGCLHRLGSLDRPGAADRSYSIQVAKLAGLPAAVIARAEAVLAALEADEGAATTTRLADDLPLFAAATTPAATPAAPGSSSLNCAS